MYLYSIMIELRGREELLKDKTDYIVNDVPVRMHNIGDMNNEGHFDLELATELRERQYLWAVREPPKSQQALDVVGQLSCSTSKSISPEIVKNVSLLY